MKNKKKGWVSYLAILPLQFVFLNLEFIPRDNKEQMAEI